MFFLYILFQGRFKSVDDLDPKDGRRNFSRFQGENFVKNLKLVDKITEFANNKGVTPSQLCLSWVIAQISIIYIYIYLFIYSFIYKYFKLK